MIRWACLLQYSLYCHAHGMWEILMHCIVCGIVVDSSRALFSLRIVATILEWQRHQVGYCAFLCTMVSWVVTFVGHWLLCLSHLQNVWSLPLRILEFLYPSKSRAFPPQWVWLNCAVHIYSFLLLINCAVCSPLHSMLVKTSPKLCFLECNQYTSRYLLLYAPDTHLHDCLLQAFVYALTVGKPSQLTSWYTRSGQCLRQCMS